MQAELVILNGKSERDSMLPRHYIGQYECSPIGWMTLLFTYWLDDFVGLYPDQAEKKIPI